MKTFTTQLLARRAGPQRRNTRLVIRFLLVLVAIIGIYSVLFHVLMLHEGQDHTWFTGVYWTLTVMSTLGFGDITFHTDLGRFFSMIVLLTGVVLLLVVLPFTFIEFILEPILRAQSTARAPRALPEDTSGHVILTHSDEITTALVHKLDQYRIPYVTLVSGLEQALHLHDLGVRVMLGDHDDPDAYRRAQVQRAALVAATSKDPTNSAVAFTVREVSPTVPIVATADDPASVDLLELAGCSGVLQPGEMLGQLLARRSLGGDAISHPIGQFDDLMLAEATAANTPLVGKTLGESPLGRIGGIHVVGIWDRGRFRMAAPDVEITSSAVLVMAGSPADFARYDELFAIYNVSGDPVIVIGAGRVGRAAGQHLADNGVDYRIIDRDPARMRDDGKHVLGNAADLPVLDRAGLRKAPTAIITTHDDDINIYLTIYCRKLRPDMQILCRATEERNVVTMHRAGADFVMSFASMGAHAVFNMLRRSDILMIAEGLSFFRLPVPRSLAGRSVGEATTFAGDGWTLVAVQQDGRTTIQPRPDAKLAEGMRMIVIGSEEAEERFLQRYA